MTLFNVDQPCPVCGRCNGFASEDGQAAHCMCRERSGGLPMDCADTFVHRVDADCGCRELHGAPPDANRTLKCVSVTYPHMNTTGAEVHEGRTQHVVPDAVLLTAKETVRRTGRLTAAPQAQEVRDDEPARRR
jgi:hypothetical protein